MVGAARPGAPATAPAGAGAEADAAVLPVAAPESEVETSGVVARVMLESPLPQLDRLFDYLVPVALVPDARPGVRVKVPLRSAGRTARGYIVELTPHVPGERALSELDEVVSPLPVLTPEVWALARRLADRAAGSACDIVRLAIPPRFVRVEKAFLARQAAADSTARAAAVTPTAFALTGYSGSDGMHLAEAGARSAIDAIATVTAVRASGDQQHTQGQDAAGQQSVGQHTVGQHTVGHWALTIAELATAVHRGGESVIVAVPDYRDQLAVEQALENLGAGDAIVRLDARQARNERYANFLTALDGDPHIVVGNRSSIYAPVSHLGQIIVWDEGDSLQSEPLAPYVHLRDAALVRQEQSGCRLAFVSHSRSTDIERLVELGFLHPVFPAPRYLPRVLPTAEQDDADAPQNAARIPTAAWQAARRALEQGPVLVQVARPGYAPVLACQSCGHPAACTVCGGPLHVHRAGERPSCTLCGAIAANWSCSHCHGTTFRFASIGAGRTADELGRAFPGTRVIVSDGERTVLTVDDKPALVVATRGAEPVAEGGYRAVLLLDGPRMLARESLRVAEDCLRWWSNAIALSAPRAPNVLVGVGGDLAKALVTWQQEMVASAELADRRALRFPPAVRLATVTGAADTVANALTELERLVTEAEWAKMDTLGPVPTGDGMVRAIVRFDYAVGASVARHLRALVVKNATTRRSKTGSGPGFRPPPTLRVRLDDSEIME
ncbi:primosomal protein N' (replication factor Y) [Herbiconiux flava]|uniref:Primosomal protein N' (Replication factor Y) n=2 Tax=Herbiconiux flava TaxID=881268 RepID=A0A852SRQ3_9MICO|nr:primosomal protein N' [Herbiconiux flava]NYD71462.1 primosomal protein N' (replication factor Y) [Herbiconiux flava]